MASASRSPLMSSARKIAAQSNLISRTLNPKSVPISPFSSSSTALPRATSRAEIILPAVLGQFLLSRIVGALGMVESMMPLHSAIASARLKSNLAVNSAYWSWLSQGLGTSL